MAETIIVDDYECEGFYDDFLMKVQDYLRDEVPELKYVDQDLGQLENYDIRPAVDFPCLLVDFTGSKFSQLGDLVEQGDTTIQFRLGFAPFSPSNGLAPQSVRAEATKFWRLENRIYRALKGWTPPGDTCQPLNRIADATEQRTDPFRVRIMVFSTAFMDSTATPYTSNVARPPLEFRGELGEGEFEDQDED